MMRMSLPDRPAGSARCTRRACRCRWCRARTASSPATSRRRRSASNILVLIQPRHRTAAADVHSVSLRRSRTAGDACRSRCRRTCTSSSSDRSIATWRTFLSIGNTLADGWSEPFLQKAGLSGAADRRREPDAAFAVEHRVVVVDPACPRSSPRPNRPTARAASRPRRGPGRAIPACPGRAPAP